MIALLLIAGLGCTDKGTSADTGETSADTGEFVLLDASNLCGTISRYDGAPKANGVGVYKVLSGHEGCEDEDTSGDDQWMGDEVASPAPVGDRFQATVDPGTYGVEVYSGGDTGYYQGCARAEVVDATTCSADITVTLVPLEYADEPNLYLYPTTPTDVEVHIPAWRQITTSDPLYGPQGWRVQADPDGRLQTPAGPRDFLFYERLLDPARLQTETGWCVDGALAQASIEDALADLGFLPNEIADFSEAWDPVFPDAEQMTIYPQISNLPALDISPPPDVLLRAWFLVANGCAPVSAPELRAPPRTGFHAAEWGLVFDDSLKHPQVLVEGWREGG